MDTQRLSRIEDKLDKLSEVVTSLARIEEKVASLLSRMDKQEACQGDLEKRIDVVEGSSIRDGAALRFAERVFWILVTAAISTGFWYLR